MVSEPRIESRPAQPYVGIRASVSMGPEFTQAIDRILPDESPNEQSAARSMPLLGGWMNCVSNPPEGLPRILPHVIYEDVGAAVRWLSDVFGFRERTWVRHVSADGVVGRAQMDVVDSVITLGTPSVHGGSPRDGVSSMLYVYVEDVDAHYARVRAAGGEIVIELDDKPWGDRSYQVRDLEGHQWTFAQHVRDVDLGVEHLERSDAAGLGC